ncbi:MAG TPA: RNA polymerase sigma factor [Gaiellaceae bacterium]|nr:RNA polymerase sigma factor [Gaiellaceae bacterium]
MAVAHEASSAVRLEPAVSETAARLFQEHSGWIYGYCLRLLRSPEEAEDALQATYLNACRGLKDGVRPQVDSAWLLRIAQNVCLTRLRSSGRRARLERVQDVELLEETVAAPAHRGDELIGLTDALASLPEQQRRAILLREWQGLSYAEVAARLELTQSAVETLIFRARRSLAAALENPGKRRRLRLAHAFDVAGLFAAFKGLFAGSASAKIAAAVVVAATTATVAATDPTGVWRDRHDVNDGAAAVVAQSGSSGRSSSALTAAAGSSVPDAAERAFHGSRGGPALDPSERRGASGPATAEAAKAKGKGSGKALGHGKKAEKAKSSNGQGTQGAGPPAFAETEGPPPHSSGQGSGSGQGQATGQAKAESEGSSGTSDSAPKGPESSQGKAEKSAKSSK